MSGLNGSADFRLAPVVRSEAEWTSIMADFERSGLSRREFCESRELSLKTFGNRGRRLPAYPVTAMQTYLEKRQPAQKRARFYRMAVMPNLFGEWTLYREWGRIGQGGQVRMDWFEDENQAIAALVTKARISARFFSRSWMPVETRK